MFHKKFLEMTADIKQFASEFKFKYGLDLLIDIGNDLKGANSDCFKVALLVIVLRD